jgi:NAD(P)-dependent dehydrogenase (short-subunit alcohol dehydrogenase family)
MGKHDGKVAIVTGGGGGIGAAVCEVFAREGAKVAVLDLDPALADESAEHLRGQGAEAKAYRADVTSSAEVDNVFAQVHGDLGGIDALVNCAGVNRQAPALEFSFEDWRHTLSVDLDGAFLCAQRAARHMVQQGRGGRIVNVTSVHEFTPLQRGVAYTVAKHGLGGLTKQLAYELGSEGITVNSVAPGFVATPMTGLEDRDPGTIAKPRFPLGRAGDAREIASCIGWLCSADAAWTTGASFVVDGGFLLVNPSALPGE